MPARKEVTGPLDPFHVNRDVLGRFPDPKMGWRMLDVLLDGDKDETVALLETRCDVGFAREGRVDRVIGYLRNNVDLIGAKGPSLGPDGVGKQTPPQVVHGVGPVRMVAHGRLGHGAATEPVGVRNADPEEDQGAVGDAPPHEKAREEGHRRACAQGRRESGRTRWQRLPAAASGEAREVQSRRALLGRFGLRDAENQREGEFVPIIFTPSKPL